MNVSQAALSPALARTDREGNLVEADPKLLDLFASAGGDVGLPLPLPEVAALERLARRLGVAMARTVTVADAGGDVEIHVRAEPDRDGVALAIAGWSPKPSFEVGGERADWLWEADAALCFTHLSVEVARYGVDVGALLGQPILRLFRFDDVSGDLPILSAVAAQMRFDGQLAELRGTKTRVRLGAEPRFDAEGRFAGYAGGAVEIGAPVTEPAPAAAEPAIDPRLDRTLRAPLERIIANAQSMSAEVEGPLAPTYTEYAGDIATAGRHLLGLVDDLIDLQAIERDDFAVELEAIDLADLARRASGLLGVRAGEGGVTIDRPSAIAALPATGEFRRALQVLVNLIGNAVRYSPEGGTVWVRAEPDGERACVIVADQGQGIAPEHHAMIFEKFGRVDPGEPGGSGLGLYISRRLARAMGGDITVDSAPGEGARFVFWLPRA